VREQDNLVSELTKTKGDAFKKGSSKDSEESCGRQVMSFCFEIEIMSDSGTNLRAVVQNLWIEKQKQIEGRSKIC
jgi:hypothetical protein